MLSNGAPSHLRNGSAGGSRTGNDTAYRHMSAGSLNIPGPQNGSSNGQPQIMGPAVSGRFEGPRSPPSKQNTSHVPCKFFRQGACQAGKACPFSHDLSIIQDSVCKYFAKGNCKFGPKCANAHVLPDGRRVNYQKGMMGGGHLNIGGRVNPDPYHGQSSALTNSLFRANLGASGPFPYPPYVTQEGNYSPMVDRRTSMDMGIPTIDTSYISQTGSAYGSPRDDEIMNRGGIGLSPINKGLSVLDAPLPASFESNGFSKYARDGPFAASVPSKFGLESPIPSLGFGSDALKNLHSSAFGDDTRDRFNGTAGSPPAATSDEYFGKRLMHSQRFSKQKILTSASLPKSGLLADRDWEPDFPFEEEYLPDNLQELLTPQEKARRGSRNAEDEGRPIHSGNGTPGDTSSKFGSPSNASPSRWGHLFQKQQREEEERASRISQFGHVGSPLRNTALHMGSSPSQRALNRPVSGDSSPFLASPPRQSSMSIISQQLQRTRLSRAESSGSDSALHPTSTSRVTSNPIGSGPRRTDMDRQVSSSSIGTGRFTTPIDEEQVDFVFSMEEEEDKEREREKDKRNSGGWSYPVGGRSPHLRAMGRNGTSSSDTNGNTGVDVRFGVGR